MDRDALQAAARRAFHADAPIDAIAEVDEPVGPILGESGPDPAGCQVQDAVGVPVDDELFRQGGTSLRRRRRPRWGLIAGRRLR